MLKVEDIVFQWWSELQRERKCNMTSRTAKIVNKSPLDVQEKVRMLISNFIKQGISESMQCENIFKKHEICNAINGCFDNFTQAIDAVNISFSEVVSFINICIDECKNKFLIKDYVKCNLVRLLDFLHCLSRVLVLVLKLRRPLKFEQKCFHLPEINYCDKEMLSKLSYKISSFFMVNEVSMDTKCTLAMASLLIREILMMGKEKLLQYHRNFLESLPKKINEKEYELNVLKFLLGNAILNTWSNTVVDTNSTGIYLRFFIQLCESYSSDTGIILNICRTLILLIKNDCFKEFMMNLNSENFHLVNSLLSCVYMLLDHPVPCVRHSSKDFLRLLAVYEIFRSSMLKSLSSLLVDKRSYFICLAAIANEAGSQCLLDINQSLPNNLVLALHDPTLVTYVINALESVILKDTLVKKDFSQWCERWVVSLLVSLTKVPSTVSADIEKLLKSLFTQYPSAIFYVIDRWFKPKNDELRYIIAALKIYHKHGLKRENIKFEMNVESSSDLQENKWKDLISEKLLRFCLHHNDDDIRVSAFSLIIEGLKSTEKYTEQDFSLIKYSLTCNLNNQQPATRQKFLSLVRKMLARYADSLVVLKRSQKSTPHSADINADFMNYTRFQEWLIDFCFSNIFDGANFNRLNTILSMLLICLEIMNDVKVHHFVVDDYWKKILIPLRSSYEENKIMAVTLAKKLNILKLYNDTETLKLMFKKAYELCGKIEPPNVLTGAYLMQMLLEYPLIKEVIKEYMSEDTNGINSELLFILLLSKKLEEQISYAEINLFKAAMAGPMYGTLFAIRIILKETDFLKLQENKVNDAFIDQRQIWSSVLKTLMELSFKMIHVVRCVVNSSSPEGHLPSDFQSNFEFMMSQGGLPQEVVEKNSEKDVEETLNEAISGIQNINFDGSRPVRRSEEIIYDCQRFIRRFNKVFLSHGDSRSFSLQNAIDIKNLLIVCTQLMSEIKKIQRNKISSDCESNQEFEFLTCLSSIENELKNCIAIYQKHSCKNDRPTAQVLLLCAWRSIKEACLFLGDLISKLPLEKMLELELLTEEMVITIGVELRTLLCEIKHRGAFEHAYVGFSQLITAFWMCPRKNLNELPEKWLQEILCEIKQPIENQKMKFCSNRRSAGLPFLVQAIISSEMQCTNSAKIHSLEITMNSLLAVAEVEENSASIESKIHSLNILRALFKHAMFGEYVAPYVSRGLMVAVRGSRAAAWSIRNSSSLLFSALVIRIFGVARNKDVLSKKNRMTGRHFFQRYPELYEFFLNEMKLAFQTNVQSHIYYPQPHVFHILLILGRLYPSPTEDPSGIDFSEFLPFINTSSRDATLKIRELGAKALVPLICPDTFIEELDMRFSFLKSGDIDNNYRHGILLQVKAILMEMWEKTQLIQESVEERARNWILETESVLDMDKKPTQYLIKISYIQILHMLSKISLSLGKQINELLDRKELLHYVNSSNEIEKKLPGRFAYLETLYFVKFDIVARIWLEYRNSDDLTMSVMSMLKSDVNEVQAIALTFLQYITCEKYEDLADEEDGNLITVKLRDLFCIGNENRFNVIKLEVLSQSAVLHYITQSFLSLLIHAKDSNYLYNVVTKLKISVISNFLLQNLISVQDIYDSYNNIQGISLLPDLLYDVVDCGSTDVSVGAFICYSVFFFESLKNNIGHLSPNSVSHFTKLLFIFSDPDADIKQRKAACEIFNKYYYLFNHDLFRKDNEAMSIWMLPLRLMSDEDLVVRRKAMRLVSKYQKYFTENEGYKKFNGEFDDISLSQLTGIPSKAQEILLEFYVCLLNGEDLFHLIVQIVAFSISAYINAISYEHTSKQNEDGVFEKGNPNPYCEELTFGKLLCRKLEELKTSIDLKSLFRKRLDSTHVANLKGFFPSLILSHFPETLNEFCIEIVNILKEENLEKDDKVMSCLPIYVSELTKSFEL